MPYIIKKVKEGKEEGYKVCKRDKPTRCFSKKPLTEETAKKQRTAIIMSEMGISRGKKGGMDKEEWPDVKKLTKNKIIERLNANGYDEVVFRMNNMDPKLKPKPKLADWKKAYEAAKKKGTNYQGVTGKVVKNEAEGMGEIYEEIRRTRFPRRSPSPPAPVIIPQQADTTQHSPKPSRAAPAAPIARPSTAISELIKRVAALPLPSEKKK